MSSGACNNENCKQLLMKAHQLEVENKELRKIGMIHKKNAVIIRMRDEIVKLRGQLGLLREMSAKLVMRVKELEGKNGKGPDHGGDQEAKGEGG